MTPTFLPNLSAHPFQASYGEVALESVIIDEGFGGLDKAGRDDMIQELRALVQVQGSSCAKGKGTAKMNA
jgi:hypothetical protein